MTIHAVDKNMNVANVVIDYRDRQEGSVSKLNTISDGIKVIGTIIKMFKNYRPFAFFSWISAILAVIALAFFCPILVKYFVEGIVTRIPTLITCGFVLIAALICWFSGIVLSTLVSQNRQNFEFHLHTVSNHLKDLRSKKD